MSLEIIWQRDTNAYVWRSSSTSAHVRLLNGVDEELKDNICFLVNIEFLYKVHPGERNNVNLVIARVTFLQLFS